MSSSPWTDEQIEVVIITTVVITLISIAAYYIISKQHHRPRQQPRTNATNSANVAHQRQATLAAVGAGGAPRPRNGGNGIDDTNVRTRMNTNMNNNPINGGNLNNNDYDNDDDEGVLSLLAANTRQPPHFSLPSSSSTASSVMSISKLQHEGVIPFRYTLASSYEAKKNKKQMMESKAVDAAPTSSAGSKPQPSAQQLANRKDRAKIFTKLFTPTLPSSSSSPASNNEGLAPPPSRGSNIIVSIPSHDVILNCTKLRRVLFLLGTYYNIFVLLSIDGKTGALSGDDKDDDVTMNDYKKDKKRLDDLILQLRGSHSDDNYLPEEIVPSHRILTTTSVSSRVAFVRQLPKAAMVLDYEEECMTQLTRFGFRVILYPLTTTSSSSSEPSSSSLGKEMFG